MLYLERLEMNKPLLNLFNNYLNVSKLKPLTLLDNLLSDVPPTLHLPITF